MAQKKWNGLRVLYSVLAAFFGVQSKVKAEEDFETGHFSTYLMIGVLATLAFVLGIIAIVTWVT